MAIPAKCSMRVKEDRRLPEEGRAAVRRRLRGQPRRGSERRRLRALYLFSSALTVVLMVSGPARASRSSAAPHFAVTVIVVGHGRVVSSPGGIACPTVCRV